MRSHVYFDGQLYHTQCNNLSKIYKEIKQSGFYEELLVLFDDKQIYQGNENISQVYGRLNIYRTKYIIEGIQEIQRQLKINEINQLEIQRLEQKVKKIEEGFRSDLKIVNQLNDLESQQLKASISSLEEKEVEYINKISNLKKENFELRNLQRQPIQNSNQEQASFNVHRQLSDKITQLRTENMKLKQELSRQSQQSQIISNQLHFNNDKHDQLRQQIDQMEQLRLSKDQEIKNLKKYQQELLLQIDKLEFELSQPRGPSQTSIIRVQNIQNDLKKQIEQLKQDKQDKEKQLAEEITRYDLQRSDNIILNKENQEVRQSLSNINKLLDKKIEELEQIQNDLNILRTENQSKEEQITQYVESNQNLKEKIKNIKIKSDQLADQLKEQVKYCEEIIKQANQEIEKKDKEIQRLKLIILKLENQNSNPQELESAKAQLKQEEDKKQNIIEKKNDYEQQKKNNLAIFQKCIMVVDVVDQINANQLLVEQNIIANKLKLDEEMRMRKQAQIDKKNLRKQQEEEKKRKEELLQEQNRILLAADLRKRCKEISDMQICFIIDTTHSMAPYFEQALKCITQCISDINNKLKREVQWGIVTYKDFDWNQPYLYQQFTKDQKQLLDFSTKITCEGGADTAEDLQGAFKIVLDKDKLRWSQAVKLCILITDSPCHGRKYSKISSDDYPNTDIEPMLKQLILENISLVGVKLNPIFGTECLTTQMYDKFEQFYKENNSPEHYHVFDLQKQQTDKLWTNFATAIAQATVKVATQNKNTFAKKKILGENNIGNMQALIQKLEDPKKFDQHKTIKPRNVLLEVLQIELKSDIENDIKSLTKPQINLIKSTNIGQWQCIMSSQPFAQGQNKSVYVMRKQNNQDEIYVLKGQLDGNPYQTSEEAYNECFSHLIAQYLMNEFKKQLQFKRKQFLDVVYSNILVLKESNSKYWIAERYFDGKFEKYNNNFGFINVSNDDLNHFAQAYTLFTLYFCDNNKMVVDIQGVGNYWTDPAIITRIGNKLNVTKGEYDNTDMGLKGISMYTMNKDLDDFKDVGQKYSII